MEELEVGKITHFFTKIGVAIVQVTAPFKVGDKVHIKGATTDITEVVESMQVHHAPVKEVNKGDDIGLKVKGQVRPGDTIFKVL